MSPRLPAAFYPIVTGLDFRGGEVLVSRLLIDGRVLVEPLDARSPLDRLLGDALSRFFRN